MAVQGSSRGPAATLPGPSRTITVEPIEAPIEQPRPAPEREPEPVEEPAVTPEREPEPEKAPSR